MVNQSDRVMIESVRHWVEMDRDLNIQNAIDGANDWASAKDPAGKMLKLSGYYIQPCIVAVWVLNEGYTSKDLVNIDA